MFEATLRALAQMQDRTLRAVLLASILWTLLLFVALALGAFSVLGTFLGPHGGGWIGAILAAAATVVALWLLFVPLAAAIATFYTDRIANAVEARWYPALPPVRPASLASQVWDGVAVFLRLVAAQLLVVIGLQTGVAAFLPGFAAAAWLALAGWAFARGVFVTLAMRRLPRGPALAAWRARRWPAIGVGVLVGALAFVPLLNLVAPILGIAALVHVLQSSPRMSMAPGRWRDSPRPRVLPRSPD
ncbi:MAG: EI24 domain-containing protein [Rhodospirillales bacterium]|nr:EI24 domain-containing protein [Rhodospirillales bacterium]